MYTEIKKEITKYGLIAANRGYTPGLSGNMSCREGEHIIITATSTANGFLEDKDFCVVDLDGNIIEGEKRASSEVYLHLDFYKQRKDINSILHFHCPYLTAFAIAGIEPDKDVLPEIIYTYNDIPIAQYALPGSQELVKNTSKYFKSHDVILMKNHGVIAGAKDLKNAFLKLETCETYAKTLLFSKILGGAKILPEEEVKKVCALRK